MSDAETSTGRKTHTYHDPAENARKINEISRGDDLPSYLSWDESGERIESPHRVSEEICQLMRTLRHMMNSMEIAAGLDYSQSTVSHHVRGMCGHWQPKAGINLTDTDRHPDMLPIADRGKVISVKGKQYYHLYAEGGVPACRRTGKKYKVWEDLEMAKTWKKPCSWCFPDREDERPEAKNE